MLFVLCLLCCVVLYRVVLCRVVSKTMACVSVCVKCVMFQIPISTANAHTLIQRKPSRSAGPIIFFLKKIYPRVVTNVFNGAVPTQTCRDDSFSSVLCDLPTAAAAVVVVVVVVIVVVVVNDKKKKNSGVQKLKITPPVLLQPTDFNPSSPPTT